ncbi:MAG: DMT family transporter [Nitratireductor sp.]
MRLALLILVTMVAFAANSVFGRIALGSAAIDPDSYTAIRLISGAAMLAVLVLRYGGLRFQELAGAGSWLSALALFAYALSFSHAYLALDAGTGALILFASVQTSMIGWALFRGDRPWAAEWAGLIVAFSAFVWLVSPGLAAPDPFAAGLMILSGISWGAYSLRGRGSGEPLRATAGNFLRSVPLALLVVGMVAIAKATGGENHGTLHLTLQGVMLALASGMLTSALGYALWFEVLKSISSTQAAILQLTVPVIAGFGGLLFLGEPWNHRFVIASVLILGGVALAILAKARRQ